MSEVITATPPPPEPPKAQMSAIARVFGVFFEPTATFADIARSPSFLLPLLLVMISACATSGVMSQRIDSEQVVRAQIMKSSRSADIPKDQLEKQVEMGAKISKYAYFAIPVIAPIFMVIIAGALLLITNFVLGGTATFKQMFSVETHAQMPGIILGILTIVILFVKDPSDITDPQNIVQANLGLLIGDETSKFGHRLLQSMDLFSFWQIYLLGKGISAVGRLSFTKGLLAVVIPWAICILIFAGLAAVR